MTRVVAIILHAVPAPAAGPLETHFAAARAANAARLATRLAGAGASVTIEDVRAGGSPFGARVRATALANRGSGLVILGSGSVPLATPADIRAFVGAAGEDGPTLTNNRYSSDILAIPASISLLDLPDVVADNGLPRWLAERGVRVTDLAARWRLQVDLDSPLDTFLAGIERPAPVGTDDAVYSRVRRTVDRIRSISQDPAAELVVAGRTSSRSLRWVERATASRTRALIEERGMRTAKADQRPARSVLGLLLDREGPGPLGRWLGELGNGAVVDSRVLMAHRLGRDETAWPPVEDRFASDLLLHERVADPWLRELTRAAVTASIPVLLGGHTLVGPGLRLLLAGRRP